MANVMQKHREAKGWTKAELARRAGLNASTVGWIESGRFTPYPSQVRKLAEALELSEKQRNGLLRAGRVAN